MVRVRGLEYPVCFDLHAESGDVLRLLSDRETGLHFYDLIQFIISYLVKMQLQMSMFIIIKKINIFLKKPLLSIQVVHIS